MFPAPNAYNFISRSSGKALRLQRSYRLRVLRVSPYRLRPIAFPAEVPAILPKTEPDTRPVPPG